MYLVALHRCPSGCYHCFSPRDRHGWLSLTCDHHKDKGTYGFWASCCSNTTISTTTNFRIQVYNVHTLSIGTVWGSRCVSLVGQRRFNKNPSYHTKPSYWSHIYGTLRPRSCRYGELTSCNHLTDFFSLSILRSR